MNSIINSIKTILDTSSNLRSANQVQLLLSFLSSLSYFKNSVIPIDSSILFNLTEHLTYEFFPAGSFIFNYGDPGDKFYIVLEGLVKIILPNFTEQTFINSGSAFGEYSLLYNKARLASILCEKDTHLVVLNKEAYLSYLGKIELKRLEDLVKFLRGFDIFKGWTKNRVIRISYFFHERVLTRKMILFKEGELINEVYFIKEGELELFKRIEEGRKKRNVNVSILAAGELVGGEVFGVEKYMYMCQVYSLIAKVLVISKNDLYSRVRNEEMQVTMKKNYDFKEKEREKRVKSLEKIRKIYELQEDEKIEGSKKRINDIVKFSQTPIRRLRCFGGDIDVKKGDYWHIKNNSASLSQRYVESIFNPSRYENLKRNVERRMIFPINIEPRQISMNRIRK